VQLNNATKLLAAYTLGVEPSGRESLVVVVKGTYTLPSGGGPPHLADEQLPLVMADTFTGEPGFSAPVLEADFAPRKPKCDVLLCGTAFAPGGRPVERVTVGIRIGQWRKALAVVGDRRWTTTLSGLGISATSAGPFVQQPVSYDVAFGGVDTTHTDPARHLAYPSNPVGRGWHPGPDAKSIDGLPLPNTEELDQSTLTPNGNYAPMAFGPVGRGWASRLPLAGTYDQDWIDNVFPFLPSDFREAYYQAAPPDQQIPYPVGPQDVTLLNLTPSGRLDFRLPDSEIPVVFFHRDGGHREFVAPLDTITFLPDQNVLTMVWRASVPLRRTVLEVADIVVGKMTPAWWRARELGKDYYESIEALAHRRAEEAAEAQPDEETEQPAGEQVS
jgi:hypothetical protein